MVPTCIIGADDDPNCADDDLNTDDDPNCADDDLNTDDDPN